MTQTPKLTFTKLTSSISTRNAGPIVSVGPNKVFLYANINVDVHSPRSLAVEKQDPVATEALSKVM